MTTILTSTNLTPLSFPSSLPKHKPRRGYMLADPTFIYSNRAPMLVPCSQSDVNSLTNFVSFSIPSRSFHEPCTYKAV